MARKYKKRVEYADVWDGLNRWAYRHGYIAPRTYIRILRRETGLSYPKIAHDLRADSGVDVSDQAVYLWGRGK